MPLVYKPRAMSACLLLLIFSNFVTQVIAQTPAQIEIIELEMPAQPLNKAITDLANRVDLTLGGDAQLLRGKQAPPLSGRYTVRQALQRLLEGSGVSYQFTDRRTVTLMASTQSGEETLEPITVQARQPGSAYGPVKGYVAERSTTATKTDVPISETPQSISIVTRDQIEARDARSVGEAVAYSAGVNQAIGEASGPAGSNIAIRGFGGRGTAGASSNEFWDGLRIQGTNFAVGGIDPYLFERIEILRGPASVLYGQNQPGGIINRVSKRPPVESQGQVLLRAGTFDTLELGVDSGGPLTDDAELSYRLIGVVTNEEAQVDFAEEQRHVISPSLTWRPSVDTSLRLQAVYQDEDVSGKYVTGLPAVGTVLDNPNGDIPRDRFIGDPSFDGWDRELFTLGYFFDHRFDDTWSMRVKGRYIRNELDLESVFNSGGGLQADNRTVPRAAFGALEEADTFAFDNQLQGQFKTGALSHTLLVGVDIQRRDADTRRTFGTAPTLDLYDPVYFQTIAEPPVFQDMSNLSHQLGIYAQDHIRLKRWILTLSGRHDWSDSENDNNINGSQTEQDDNAFTGRAGLGYKFDAGVTPYLGYSESFEPQSGTDFQGNVFEPTTGEQYEVGVKYEPLSYNAFVTLSVFNLTQQNVVTGDPNNPGFSVQTGEIRSRGVELEGVASLTSGWDLIASYSYLDSEITQNNDGNEGNRVEAIPEQQAKLWSAYTFRNPLVDGFRIGAGVRYVGAAEGDRENTFEVPSFTLIDASVAYPLENVAQTLAGTTFAVNISNLADKEYVASCFATTRCHFGVGRKVIARLSHEW